MRRLRIIFCISVLLVGIVAGGGYLLYRSLMDVVHDAYGVWTTANMVHAHIQMHDEWPRSWGDLYDDFNPNTCMGGYGNPWTFDDLSHRVVVDWNADLKHLKEMSAIKKPKPFRVIWLADGSDTHYSGSEPNELLANYLSGRFQVDWKSR